MLSLLKREREREGEMGGGGWGEGEGGSREGVLVDPAGVNAIGLYLVE